MGLRDEIMRCDAKVMVIVLSNSARWVDALLFSEYVGEMDSRPCVASTWGGV